MFARCAMIFPLNRVGARVFINLENPALGKPADIDLQDVSFLDPALVNAKGVAFHLVYLAGSIGTDVIIVDPTAPPYGERSWMRLGCLARRRCLAQQTCFDWSYYGSFGGDFFRQTGSFCSGLLAESG